MNHLYRSLGCDGTWLQRAERLLGALLCLYGLRWLLNAHYFLSDGGPLPRACILRDVFTSRYGLSLYMLNGFVYWGVFLLLVQIGCGVALLRQRQRLPAIWLGWLLVLSYLVRAPWSADNGAQLLALTLLWFGLLHPDRPPGLQLSPGTVALTLQALVNVAVLEWFVLGHSSEFKFLILAVLTLTPHRWTRGLALAGLAWTWLSAGDPWLSAVALVGLLPLIPTTASQLALEVHWSRWGPGMLLVFVWISASAGQLFGSYVARPVQRLAWGLGLVQDFAAPPTPLTFEVEMVFSQGAVVRWRQGHDLASWDRRRHLLQLGTGSAGVARSYYLLYAARRRRLRVLSLSSLNPAGVRVELGRWNR